MWKAVQVETSFHLAHHPSYVAVLILSSNVSIDLDAIYQKKGDLEFWQRVHTLPLETYQNIIEYVFQVTVGPKRIHPQSEQMNLHILESLDRKLYVQKRKIFWSENTWVLGEGSRCSPHGFLNMIPKRAFNMIRKLELHLTLQNTDGLPMSLDHYFREERNDANPYDTSDILRCFKWETWARVVKQTNAAWKLSLSAIKRLRLEYLLFDFTKVYAPDNEYFILRLARATSVLRFEHGLPDDFCIVAPTPDLDAENQGMYVRTNQAR